MKIVVAPDSYKDSLPASEVCVAMKNGIKRVLPDAEVIMKPMADGGEGTVHALVYSTGGSLMSTSVMGPLGEVVEAAWGILGDKKTAVIEMAEASGIQLIEKGKLNPLYTTSYGTGQLIKEALDHGCEKVILGIGGSATNDGGVGMASALGIKFLDRKGEDLTAGGGSLDKLERIIVEDMDPRILSTQFLIACDVINPLCGPNGASAVYGPQKGATQKMVEKLDKGLNNYANILKQQLSLDIKNAPGAGAGGGIGAGVLAFLNGELRPGIEIILESLDLENVIKNSNLIITGEGKTDIQTSYGKAPMGIGKLAKEKCIPVICVSGSIGSQADVLEKHGINACFSIINQPMSLEEAISNSKFLIEEKVKNLMEVYILRA